MKAVLGHRGWFTNCPGVIASDERTSEFTAVRSFRLSGHPAGTTQSVKVTADDNLLSQLDTRVSSGVLYIERGDVPHAERVSPTETVQIELTVRDLEHLDFGAAGSITIENLQTETLSVSLGGVGEIRMLTRAWNMDGPARRVLKPGAAEDPHLDLSGRGVSKQASSSDAGCWYQRMGSAKCGLNKVESRHQRSVPELLCNRMWINHQWCWQRPKSRAITIFPREGK
jgi:hypothetical protein